MSPWQLLELEPGSSEADIRKAWKRLARKHHPDLNPGDPQAEARFKQLSAAYEQLLAGGFVPSRRQGFDDDQLATLEWIVEIQLRSLKTERIPAWVQRYGSGPVLLRTLMDNLVELDQLEGRPASWWTRRSLRGVLGGLQAGVAVRGPRWRLVMIEPHYGGGVSVLISLPALEAQGPWDEDELREVVQKALTAGVVAALPVLLKVSGVPLQLDEARRLERAQTGRRRFWQLVWLGVALLTVLFIGGALLGLG